MTKKNKKGLFITLEGIEGVGKSTALKCLEHYFQTIAADYILTREPGGTEVAEAIRQLLLRCPDKEPLTANTELLLLFAGRAQHIATVIAPALAMGKIVVSDRFTDATYAYQGGGRGIDKNHIATLEQWIQGGLQPDLTILLDAPIEIGLSRILQRSTKDRIEQEEVEFFQRVRSAYLERSQLYPERFKILDATLDLDHIQTLIREMIASLIITQLT